ncbi:unnamed protein product [Meloidogyne enterolobii]|uniref:Uncharacterized protein n=1 Tax=Meloidogyne enterolobii TaxID=390850 RepID=A0ACB0Y8A9_MELEN
MIILRSWLEHLFNCAFEDAYFNKIIFNPKLISLLFDNDKTIPPHFHIHRPIIDAGNTTIKNIFEFALNHLKISGGLGVSFVDVDNSEQYIDMIFNILINEGNKLPKVYLAICGLTRLYYLIVEHIITSKDCSKMVADINLDYVCVTTNFKLNERAKKVEIKTLKYNKDTKFQLGNIYNSKVKFEFYNQEGGDGAYIMINLMK